MLCESNIEIVGDSLRLEVFKRDFVTQSMGLKIQLYVPQWMFAERDVHWTVGCDDQQPRRIALSCKIGDQIERRVIAPVQIFEHQHEWRCRGYRFEKLRHLAEHSFASCADHRALEALNI